MKKIIKYILVFLVIFEILIFADIIALKNVAILRIHNKVTEKIATIYKKVSNGIEKYFQLGG